MNLIGYENLSNDNKVLLNFLLVNKMVITPECRTTLFKIRDFVKQNMRVYMWRENLWLYTLNTLLHDPQPVTSKRGWESNDVVLNTTPTQLQLSFHPKEEPVDLTGWITLDEFKKSDPLVKAMDAGDDYIRIKFKEYPDEFKDVQKQIDKTYYVKPKELRYKLLEFKQYPNGRIKRNVENYKRETYGQTDQKR
jgi:hypothetical protein